MAEHLSARIWCTQTAKQHMARCICVCLHVAEDIRPGEAFGAFDFAQRG